MFSIIKGTLVLGTNYDQGTFSDYHFSYTVSDAICGGMWRDGNSAGFFETANGGEVASGCYYYGSRLSKN